MERSGNYSIGTVPREAWVQHRQIPSQLCQVLAPSMIPLPHLGDHAMAVGRPCPRTWLGRDKGKHHMDWPLNILQAEQENHKFRPQLHRKFETTPDTRDPVLKQTGKETPPEAPCQAPPCDRTCCCQPWWRQRNQ